MLLDVTDQVVVDREYYVAFSSKAHSPAAKAVVQSWERGAGSTSGLYVWDVVATAGLTMPEVARWESLSIDSVTDEPNNLEQTREQEGRPSNASVCVLVDVRTLPGEIIGVLNQRH